MLPGGCGAAGTPAGLWGLAALMWVCNKGLCLGEIPLLLLCPPWACSVQAGVQPPVLLGPPQASPAALGSCSGSGQ